MANFTITNSTNVTAQSATAAVYTTLIGVAASSGSFANPPTITGLRRGKLYDILVGTNTTPADNFLEFIVSRATVGSSPVWVGSVSSVSSTFANDQADAAFAAFATVNASAASSTAFSVLTPAWYIGLNQRASFRWVAAPGSEITYPAVSSATGNNGLLLGGRSGAYVGTLTGTIMFQEQ